MPKNFAIGFKNVQGKSTIVEFVPKGQTVEQWKQMITLNIIEENALNTTNMYQIMKQSWESACPNGQVIPIRSGQENGYPFAFWMMTCERNPQTGKPEYTWVKAVRGQKALYAAQYAFRYAPSKQEVVNVTKYLKDVGVK